MKKKLALLALLVGPTFLTGLFFYLAACWSQYSWQNFGEWHPESRVFWLLGSLIIGISTIIVLLTQAYEDDWF